MSIMLQNLLFVSVREVVSSEVAHPDVVSALHQRISKAADRPVGRATFQSMLQKDHRASILQ